MEEQLLPVGLACPFAYFSDQTVIVSHLTFVRNAFSGIPTLYKEYIATEDLEAAKATSDIL